MSEYELGNRLTKQIAELQAEVKQGHTCNACLKDQLKNGKHECCVCPDGCDVDGIILQLRSKITSQAAEIVELKSDIKQIVKTADACESWKDLNSGGQW